MRGFSRARKNGREFGFRPTIELLETRSTPALITVNSLVDPGVIGDNFLTLREALDVANTDTIPVGMSAAEQGQFAGTLGDDTIVFDGSLFAGGGKTLLLDEAELEITSTLSIVGPGSDLLAIDAGGGSRVFNINDNDPDGSQVVTLSGLTISGGSAANGGGILNRETTTLLDTVVTGNTADTNGGGIRNNNGTLTLTNSTVSGNSADYGGGIFTGNNNATSVSLTDSTISGNSAGNYGGGMYVRSGTVTLTDSAISGNVAQQGGGIFQQTSSVSLTSSTISGNIAGVGGGSYLRAGDARLSLISSTISGNSAQSGGGVFNLGKLTLTRSTLSGNFAQNGGGIFNYRDEESNGHTVTLNSSTIAGNTASGSGGGILNQALLFINNSTVSGNFATDEGGGILNSQAGYFATLSLTNSTVSGNSADLGGGLFNRAAATINDSTISGNSAIVGGGVYNNDTISIAGSTLATNTATASPNGGFGAALYNRGSADIASSTISNNSAVRGGGVYNFSNGTVTITNSTLSGNTATSDGGGIYNDSGTVDLVSSTVSGNSAANLGGGVYNSSTVNLTNTIIANSLGGPDVEGVGVFNTNGVNLVEDNSVGGTLYGDPLLGPLQNNGGPTLTHALLTGSQAIGVGDNAYINPPDTDQRGAARLVGTYVDLGAYEAGPAVIAAAKSALLVNDVDNDGKADPGDTIRYTITVGVTGNDTAFAVTVADVLANSTLVVSSITTTQGGLDTATATSLVVGLGAMPLNTQATVVFDVIVGDAPSGTTAITNTAQVSAIGIADLDTNTTSIPFDETLPVTPLPPLATALANNQDFTIIGATGSPTNILSVKIFDGSGNLVNTVQPFNHLTSLRVAAGDFDGDGLVDEFAVLGRRTGIDFRGEIVTYELDASGNATETGRFDAFAPGIFGNGFITTGDFDGDGDDDIAVAQIGGGRVVATVQIHVNNGGSFTAGGATTIDFGVVSAPRIAAGDTDGDGFAEIVVAARTPAGARVLVFDADDPTQAPSRQGAGFTWDFGVTGYSRGAFVAVGELDSTSNGAEIILGSNVGGGGRVDIVSYDGVGAATLVENGRLTPFGDAYNAAVRVAAGQLDDRTVLVVGQDRFQAGQYSILAREVNSSETNPPFEEIPALTALTADDGLAPATSPDGNRTLGPFVAFANLTIPFGATSLLAPSAPGADLLDGDPDDIDLAFVMERDRTQLGSDKLDALFTLL